MKKVALSYHRHFPWTPVSHWAGARRYGWINRKGQTGQWLKPSHVPHPFERQRNRWCRLEVHFQGVDLVFAIPAELDHFIDVLSQNPMPSGGSLVKGNQQPGRPKSHWLSRLPAKAKPWKFRQNLVDFLRKDKSVSEFRAFYEGEPLRFSFDGYFDDFYAAKRAQLLSHTPAPTAKRAT